MATNGTHYEQAFPRFSWRLFLFFLALSVFHVLWKTSSPAIDFAERTYFANAAIAACSFTLAALLLHQFGKLFHRPSTQIRFWVAWLVTICAVSVAIIWLTDSLMLEFGVSLAVSFAIPYSCLALRSLRRRKPKNTVSAVTKNGEAAKEG